MVRRKPPAARIPWSNHLLRGYTACCVAQQQARQEAERASSFPESLSCPPLAKVNLAQLEAVLEPSAGGSWSTGVGLGARLPVWTGGLEGGQKNKGETFVATVDKRRAHLVQSEPSYLEKQGMRLMTVSRSGQHPS